MWSCLSSAPHPPATANGATDPWTTWNQSLLSSRFGQWTWEHGACAAALMLRADIRQFSIVRRPVNEDIMRSSPYVAGRHSLDHVNQRHVNAIENSLITLAACALPGWRRRVAIAPWFDSFMFKLRPPSTVVKSMASPVCKHHEIGRFWVQNFGWTYVENMAHAQ